MAPSLLFQCANPFCKSDQESNRHQGHSYIIPDLGRVCNACGVHWSKYKSYRNSPIDDQQTQDKILRLNGGGPTCCNPNCSVSFDLCAKIGGKAACKGCKGYAEHHKGEWKPKGLCDSWRLGAIRKLLGTVTCAGASCGREIQPGEVISYDDNKYFCKSCKNSKAKAKAKPSYKPKTASTKKAQDTQNAARELKKASTNGSQSTTPQLQRCENLYCGLEVSHGNCSRIVITGQTYRFCWSCRDEWVTSQTLRFAKAYDNYDRWNALLGLDGGAGEEIPPPENHPAFTTQVPERSTSATNRKRTLADDVDTTTATTLRKRQKKVG